MTESVSTISSKTTEPEIEGMVTTGKQSAAKKVEVIGTTHIPPLIEKSNISKTPKLDASGKQ